MLLPTRKWWAGDKPAEWPGLSLQEQGQCHSGMTPETWLDRGKIISLQMCPAEHLP